MVSVFSTKEMKNILLRYRINEYFKTISSSTIPTQKMGKFTSPALFYVLTFHFNFLLVVLWIKSIIIISESENIPLKETLKGCIMTISH
jgi:hypothetical protein